MIFVQFHGWWHKVTDYCKDGKKFNEIQEPLLGWKSNWIQPKYFFLKCNELLLQVLSLPEKVLEYNYNYCHKNVIEYFCDYIFQILSCNKATTS